MLKTLESITSSISGATIEDGQLCIIFSDIVMEQLIGLFVRNVRMIVVSDKQEKYNKLLNRVSSEAKGARLIITLKIRKIDHDMKIGDEIIFLWAYHFIAKFTVREDFEAKLRKA
ncbi:MAG: hypothetical protein ACD_56C00050G0003 [uncultured bacterium]|nr:MAG: hypothetical protein ACD_56C00050G0003 [uncultured bacterium]